MRRFLGILVPLALSLSLSSCGQAPEVLQGQVVNHDAATKTLLVKDERAPGGVVTFSLESADLGAEPQVNDRVRIAYRPVGERLVALRVMNLTRQHEIGIPGK